MKKICVQIRFLNGRKWKSRRYISVSNLRWGKAEKYEVLFRCFLKWFLTRARFLVATLRLLLFFRIAAHCRMKRILREKNTCQILCSTRESFSTVVQLLASDSSTYERAISCWEYLWLVIEQCSFIRQNQLHDKGSLVDFPFIQSNRMVHKQELR